VKAGTPLDGLARSKFHGKVITLSAVMRPAVLGTTGAAYAFAFAYGKLPVGSKITLIFSIDSYSLTQIVGVTSPRFNLRLTT
jgi:hypothetical protein